MEMATVRLCLKSRKTTLRQLVQNPKEKQMMLFSPVDTATGKMLLGISMVVFQHTSVLG